MLAKRYRHQHWGEDLLSIAVAGVTYWMSEQRLDLAWYIEEHPCDDEAHLAMTMVALADGNDGG